MVLHVIVSRWLVHPRLKLSLTCIYGGGRIHYVGSTLTNITRYKKKKMFFSLSKRKWVQYLVENITDADYADDLALLTNKPAQAESLLHSLEQAAKSNNLGMNANKTKFMCFKQTGTVSTYSGKALKFLD